MTISALHDSRTTAATDLLAFMVFQDPSLFAAEKERTIRDFGITAARPLATKDFSGKEGETLLMYHDGSDIPRLLLIGVGMSDKFTVEKLRRATATAAKKAKSLKLQSVIIEVPEIAPPFSSSAEEIAAAMTEASLLSIYKYDKYISKTEQNERTLSHLSLRCSTDSLKETEHGIRIGRIIAEATIHARDLANAPGSEIYPETLAAEAQRIGKRSGFSVSILKKKEIAKLGMGGVIGVSKGSEKEPRFIILEHGKQYRKKGTIVLVGKGVTFDTGGISIKPSANMAEMKMDMSGAAAVIGTFSAAAQLHLHQHLVGLIPAVENMPDGSAVKPGDIIRHLNGKTSEVDNTDAEGRLILADALSYASRYSPEVVIDLATLTGACVVALGHYASGMMGNDQSTMDALKIAGERSYDRVWQLPMFDEYEKLIKSDVADVKNVGGRWAGAITAGWFLKKFIGEYKWVHLDIAGTAIQEEHQDYIPRGGSGAGVRLLVEYLRSLP